jgi:hypothetical protein
VNGVRANIEQALHEAPGGYSRYSDPHYGSRNRATLVAGHTISEATLSLRTDPEITCQTTISPGDLAARHANTSSRYRRNWDH